MITIAKMEDLNEIIDVYSEIKNEMRQLNNPQWGSTEEDYPSNDIIKEDIERRVTYKYVEDGVIKGVFSLVEDDREYDEVIENSKEKSYIIHRLAVPMKYRKNQIGTKLMEFAEEIAKANNAILVKSDTEISNDKMNKLFEKLGYSYKGIFSYDDYPGTYNYYEKNIRRR